MTTSQNSQPTTTPEPTTPSTGQEPPFLTLHSTVVLLVAVAIGFVIGVLTALTSAPPAAAVIAGITSAGGSIPALRTLIR
ncbi:hypothetical protein [Kitasatospora arboriphila]|uniref:SpdD protein n=1 Tax=Kitasatospora arboriphila TaxID=258052 RepID=A0ABP4EHW1_9ACTN